jgi:threonine/homoserine/homoserine lactone efflux protein
MAYSWAGFLPQHHYCEKHTAIREIKMTNESWLIYVLLVVAACATPGPAVLFAIMTSTNYGWKKALWAASGNITGLLCLGVIAVTGLGALLDLSTTLFNIVKFFGAAYLIYMGIKLIRSKASNSMGMKTKQSTKKTSSGKLFIQAMTVAISNPKAIVFLTALLPQFMNVKNPLLPQFVQLMGTLMFFSFLFLMAYALLAYKIKDWLKKPGSGKTFNRISGFIFVAFGLLLATSSQK